MDTYFVFKRPWGFIYEKYLGNTAIEILRIVVFCLDIYDQQDISRLQTNAIEIRN